MRRNIQRLLSVLTLAITLICPLKGWAQESSIQDTESSEKQSAHKWYNYLWQHLQFTKNIGYNMYGDNVANKVEYGFTLLPLVKVGNTSLRRDISIGSGEDMETLYESEDNSLDKYLNKFGCQLRFSCLYKGIIGGYVEFGTMSMSNNLKHDIYSFSIGVQVQLTPKNL